MKHVFIVPAVGVCDIPLCLDAVCVYFRKYLHLSVYMYALDANWGYTGVLDVPTAVPTVPYRTERSRSVYCNIYSCFTVLFCDIFCLRRQFQGRQHKDIKTLMLVFLLLQIPSQQE